jgi:hypothetical protein
MAAECSGGRAAHPGVEVGEHPSPVWEIGRIRILAANGRWEEAEAAVALKLLSPHLSTDAAAKRRFVEEARAASALDHRAWLHAALNGPESEGGLALAP